jgi:hypothetical protein
LTIIAGSKQILMTPTRTLPSHPMKSHLKLILQRHNYIPLIYTTFKRLGCRSIGMILQSQKAFAKVKDARKLGRTWTELA